jgi:4-hydroxy-tetrahydrodipicolinate reductase
MGIKVIVNGANGRMGQESVKAISVDPELELVAQADKTSNLSQLITETKAQVVVDFTLASVAFANAQQIIQAGARPVIGTSGLLTEQIDILARECAMRKIGGIIAPNFSLGAVLMMQFAQTAARYLQQVEIIEMHHERKQDSPSGTAIKTAEIIAEQRGQQTARSRADKEVLPGARGANYQGIPIHAIRLPGILAYQEVIFGAPGETLSLKHNTLDRSAFMPGVCLACKKVMQLNELVYGLEHIL